MTLSYPITGRHSYGLMNKTKLLQFLSKKAVEVDPEIGCVVATNGDHMLCNIPDYSLTVLTICYQEEGKLTLFGSKCS